MKPERTLSNGARRAAYASGFAGAAVIAISALLTAISYRGEYGERYSFFNHYISELGEIGVSELAPLFNMGLIVGGLLLAVFMIALGLTVRSWIMAMIAAVGLVAAAGLTSVGVFPIGEGQSLELHVLAAATFFLSGLLFTTLFTLYLLLSRQTALPKRLALPSALAALAFLAFLFLPRLLFPELGIAQHFGGSGASRAAFWLPPFLEWLILFAMTVWIVVVSRSLANTDT